MFFRWYRLSPVSDSCGTRVTLSRGPKQTCRMAIRELNVHRGWFTADSPHHEPPRGAASVVPPCPLLLARLSRVCSSLMPLLPRAPTPRSLTHSSSRLPRTVCPMGEGRRWAAVPRAARCYTSGQHRQRRADLPTSSRPSYVCECVGWRRIEINLKCKRDNSNDERNWETTCEHKCDGAIVSCMYKREDKDNQSERRKRIAMVYDHCEGERKMECSEKDDRSVSCWSRTETNVKRVARGPHTHIYSLHTTARYTEGFICKGVVNGKRGEPRARQKGKGELYERKSGGSCEGALPSSSLLRSLRPFCTTILFF